MYVVDQSLWLYDKSFTIPGHISHIQLYSVYVCITNVL